MLFESNSPDDTRDFAKGLAVSCKSGTVITLNGDLGVGKTVFTQGFAEGLGICDYVCSPTFTILQIYEDGRMPLYHFDVYRIADESEMEEIGYEDYFYSDGVSIIEWAENIRDLIPEDAVHITISKDLGKGLDYRRIEVAGGDFT